MKQVILVGDVHSPNTIPQLPVGANPLVKTEMAGDFMDTKPLSNNTNPASLKAEIAQATKDAIAVIEVVKTKGKRGRKPGSKNKPKSIQSSKN